MPSSSTKDLHSDCSNAGGGGDYVSLAVNTISPTTAAARRTTDNNTTTTPSSASSPPLADDDVKSSNNKHDSSTAAAEQFEDEYYNESSSSSSFSSLMSSWSRTLRNACCFCCLSPLNMSFRSKTTSPRGVAHDTHKSSSSSSSSDKSSSACCCTPSPRKNTIDWKSFRLQVSLFFQMALPYYRESSTGRCLLVVLLVLTVMNAAISALFSFLSKDFWNALSDRNVEDFQVVLIKYMAALIFGAPFIALYKFTQEQLAVHWREWMTHRTLQLYTQNRMYYKLERCSCSNNSNGEDVDDKNNTSSNTNATLIDNPDQRISQDIESFTSFSLSLLVTLLISFLDLVVFSVILWMIYPSLFIAIIGYAAVGTVITTLLGHVLIRLNFGQLQKEANLRYALVRWRDNAESIAFYKGEQLEGQTVQERVNHVMTNRRRINVAVRNLEFFTNSYQFLVQILPIMVVSSQYFGGEISLGIISQSVGAFSHILSDMSIIVTQFEQLSTFAAGIERLSTFYQAMKAQQSNKYDDDTASLLHVYNDNLNDDDDKDKPAPPCPTAEASSSPPPPLPDYGSMEGAGQEDEVNKNGATTSASRADSTATAATTASYVPMDDDGEAGDDKKNGKFGTIALETFSSATTTMLSIHGLDLCTPDRKRLLVQNLHVQLEKGQHLLIVGNSGAGKSSLLRAIAGLWTAGNGRIQRPDDDQVYFLPQRPYCTVGSLKDQLLYPSTTLCPEDGNSTDDKTRTTMAEESKRRDIDTDYLLSILKQVDLWSVASRVGDGNPVVGLDTVLDWTNVLSLGEQQRLAFGRLLVNKPRLAILDESTSALDMASEARMYALLQQQQNTAGHGGLTYISVGHRPSLVQYHDKRLRLMGGEEGYELSDIVSDATT